MPKTVPWTSTAATGIGSLPGTDIDEAVRLVLGELPELPHLPELPARGVGADMIGRTAATLVDLAVEEVPSGYRVTAKAGRDHRRGKDLLARDLDALADGVDRAGAPPPVLKLQFAGPWTLAAHVELPRGHRVLTDHGALREFTESLVEGIAAVIDEVSDRIGAPVVVQLDEPSLPAVLAGSLPTPSGYGTVAAVPEPVARQRLSTVIDAVAEVSDQPVIVHCCAPRPPVALLHDAGASAIALDASGLANAPGTLLDELGGFVDDAGVLLLGLVPSSQPRSAATPPTLRTLAQPALDLVARLGFSRDVLARQAMPTPTCGLAGASAEYLRWALRAVRELGKAFAEPPQDW
ncbi:MAG: methionine synthase [Sciscionella sp.]|nr:methionine synthase [Sciscionella sp.]